VTDLKTLLGVRDHFLIYILQPTKLIYFQLWCTVLNMLVTKEHRTWEGLSFIVALKTLFPFGLSAKLRKAFLDLPFVEKPEFIPSTGDLDPDWIVGFVNGDGSFILGSETSNTKGAFKLNPRFAITQHQRDKVLLERILIF
jgi:hypothetical protein